jgi:hypothetical protein
MRVGGINYAIRTANNTQVHLHKELEKKEAEVRLSE